MKIELPDWFEAAVGGNLSFEPGAEPIRSTDEMAEVARLGLAIGLYYLGELTAGKAAELAGIESRMDFWEKLGELGLPKHILNDFDGDFVLGGKP